jgi:hypothetical protein
MAVGDSQTLNQVSSALSGFFLQAEKLQSSQVQNTHPKSALLPWTQKE